MAKRPKSQAIHRLPSFSATAAVVPLPQKQSRTRSPSFEDALITRSRSVSGFWVGYPVFCGLAPIANGISQVSGIIAPNDSSSVAYLLFGSLPPRLRSPHLLSVDSVSPTYWTLNMLASVLEEKRSN